MKDWSNLAQVVYKRTYARKDNGKLETWEETIDRAIAGNVRNHEVSKKEIERLKYFLLNRKATPGGRGLWFSGSPGHERLGGVALNNCWALSGDDWYNLVVAQDLLMLGGGVGMSVEHKFVSKLPRIKKDVKIIHKNTYDAKFMVPDSREGWCDLIRKVLKSYFETGRSFDYSTACIRGAGEPIKGFGGTASGPGPLVGCVEKICEILKAREGKHIRPIDMADLLCCIGEMVVAGNVRRSAIIILGDAWDKEYLKAKRWDLGSIPTQRAMANFSVVCDDVEDLHPLFWKTYESGEPFGIINRTNIQKYGRMGELKKDSAVLVNPCVPAGTEILTDKGYFKIDKLVGQTVNVWNGWEFSPVQPQITGTDQDMVKISLSSGQSIVCTKAHNFLIQDTYRSSPYLVAAQALKVGDKLAKTEMPTITGGDEVNLKQAYSQGFYSGDGLFNSKAFCLYGEKVECFDRLKGKLGAYSEAQDRTYFVLDFEPENKNFVPFNWHSKAKLQWLAGLIDSDGTELKEGGCQIGSIDLDFLLKTQKMLTTLGVTSKVTQLRDGGMRLLPDGKGGTKEYYCQPCYRLLIGSIQMQHLKFIGLNCVRHEFNKTPQRDASQFVKVLSIEPAGKADVVYCFKEGKRGLGCFEGIVTGQCSEACLESYEPCNLLEIYLPNLKDEEEFIEAAILMHRWGKRVTCEKYHHEKSDEVVKRNRRIGTGITGCLASPLFNPDTLDKVYKAIQKENISYSKELKIPESIRTTVIKPSGTLSKVGDLNGYEGIHPAYSRYYIQRIRFSASDPLVDKLRKAGHNVQPVIKFDNTYDHNTVVVDFYCKAPEGFPVADENWDTFKQLEAVKMAQKHWADQSISVTVYYKKEDLNKIKEWLKDNLKYLKTISFLCYNDHGFKQAPKEAITKEQYEEYIKNITPINVDDLNDVQDIEDMDCAGGACPIK